MNFIDFLEKNGNKFNKIDENFFFIHKSSGLLINSSILHNFVTNKIFIAGKFNELKIGTEKKIDICVDKFFITMIIYLNNIVNNQLMSNMYEKIYSNDDYFINDCAEISLFNETFRIFFFNFAKIQAKNCISSFYYTKEENINQILNISDCSIEFARKIPGSFKSISITRSDIVLADKRTEFLCLNYNFVRLHIKQSLLNKIPIFKLFQCDFYVFLNEGDFECIFDENSNIRIHDHRGNVKINEKFHIYFENKVSLFQYEPRLRLAYNLNTNSNNEVQYFFRQVTFLNNISINLKQLKMYRLIKCKFQMQCKLYFNDTENNTIIDVFEREGRTDNYHNFFIDLEMNQQGYQIINFYT